VGRCKPSYPVISTLFQQKGVISYQVVQEFFNVALRRFTPPMIAVEAEQYFTTVFRPILGVQSSTVLYIEALRLHAGGNLSWYDSLIVAAALEARCDLLLTEDLQHGQRFGSLRITNPFL
jgi:predicted nucleic acid-binding protein